MIRPIESMANGAAAGLLDEAGERILRAASLAASSHNIQPWIVKVPEPRRWLVCADPARRLPAVDPDNREPLLSIGAFLENLVLAAGAVGFRADLRHLGDEPLAEELVEVRLAEARPTGYPLERIALRRTLRRGFRDTPLSAAHVAALLAPFRGQARFWARDSEGGRHLSRGTLEAFRQQSWRDDAQAELAAWIRFAPDEAQQTGDGLTPATMEIDGVGGWFLRRFYDRSKVMSPGFRKRGIRGVAEQVEHAGGWIVAWTAGRSVPALIDAGRRLQSCLLSARPMGVAVHPMTQMIQERPWHEELAPRLGVPGSPQLVLRCGYVDAYPEPVSLRRPVEEFVLPCG